MSNQKENNDGRHRSPNPQVYSGPVGQPGAVSGLYAQIAALARHAASLGPYAERKPIENAGIRAGEITGWRTWRVKDGFLHSAYMQQVRWPPRHPLRATGMTDHENGIYVLDNEKAAYEAALEYMMWDMMSYVFNPPPPVFDVFVIGTASFWGDVVEHERGWRASIASVKSIYNVVSGNVDLSALRERYGL